MLQMRWPLKLVRRPYIISNPTNLRTSLRHFFIREAQGAMAHRALRSIMEGALLPGPLARHFEPGTLAGGVPRRELIVMAQYAAVG